MDLATLQSIWAGIIAFAILVYVMLDGFDLGVGILFAFTKTKRCDSRCMRRSRRFGTGTKPGWF